MKTPLKMLVLLLACWLPLQVLALSLLPCEQLLHADTSTAVPDCHGEPALLDTVDQEHGNDCVHCEGLCRNLPNIVLPAIDNDKLASVHGHPGLAASRLLSTDLERLRRPPR